jgi:pre-mRNA-splicing factor ISY1
MARNEEKAQSILNRWLSQQRPDTQNQRRPAVTSECKSLGEAERWRMQLLKEIGNKVMYIQNAGLEEHKIRDLNDQINRLMREKHAWERRIRELGGPDYTRMSLALTDDAIKGQGGYMYFGAAKDLPGVRELMRPRAPDAPRKTRAELYKNIDADYYGYRDEDDGLLLKLEAEQEKQVLAEAVSEWNDLQRQKLGNSFVEPNYKNMQSRLEDSFVSHVKVPTREEVEKVLLEKRRQELLAKVQNS